MSDVRGIKRKADGMNISVPTTQPVIPAATAVLTVPSDLIQPLYCKLCSVSLNSSQQAMAHYQGKNHGKKVRQYLQKQGQVLLQVHLQAQQKQLQLPENKVAILPEQNGVQKSKEAEENHVIKTEVNKSPTHVVMHSKLASMDDFCKVCAVSFNSPTQAQSHYQGKSHAKKLKSVESPPPVIDNNNTINQESTSPKQNKKFMCFACSLSLNSQAQLESHLKSFKHQQKVTLDKRGGDSLKGRWGASNGTTHMNGTGAHNGVAVGIPVVTANMLANQTPLFTNVPQLSPPPAKRPTPTPRPKDLAMCMTPSGKFYCACCDLTLNSEVQYRQHLQSKKHRAKHACYKKPELL